ncbi:MAG: hypothetical protein PHR35_10305 [Kiritimatiellae bacterium]|nr:hypothetical protein [Kiritimatiellia bacterium]
MVRSQERKVCAAACALVTWLSFASAAVAQAPDPPWRFPDAPVRAVFTPPVGQSCCLVQLPALLTNGVPVGRVAAEVGGAPRPVRVVTTNGASLNLLVDCAGLPANAVVALYAVTNGGVIVPDAAFAHPQPVAVAVQRSGAHEAPPTWEEMRFMVARTAADRRVTFLTNDLQSIQSRAEGGRNWHEGGWQRPFYVARLSGWLLVKQAGSYRLALESSLPSYLLMNGALAAQNARPPRPGWQTGEVLTLAAGLNRWEIMQVCENEIAVRAGWIAPGGDGQVVPWPREALLTGAGPVAARIERQGALLHAGADYHMEPGYAFQGVPVTFTPVSLRSLHAVRDGAQTVTCHWRSRGALLGSAPEWRHVFTGSDAQPIELEVVSSTGQRATASLTLELPAEVSAEYRLASRLWGVPAICYDDDPVQPEIHFRGTTPVQLPLEVEALVVDAGGRTNRIASTLALAQGWGRLPLPCGDAREFGSIRWFVRHAGVEVNRGAVNFWRQPFERLPADWDGDLLSDGGENCILAPRRASSGHPLPFRGLRPGQRLAVLDGFLTPLTGNGGGDGAVFDRGLLSDLQIFGGQAQGLTASNVVYRRVTFESLGAPLRTRCPGRLAPLARLSLLLPADTVAIAPNMFGAAGGENMEDFERRLAALVGLLHDAARCQVVLITPPPGLIPCATIEPSDAGADPMRPFAEAVVRVADAYGVTVADFYTMCYTRPAAVPVRDGYLTDEGRALAAETLARTLAGGRSRVKNGNR